MGGKYRSASQFRKAHLLRLSVFPDKVCKACGKPFNRQIMPSGRREAVEDFSVRKFCSRECWRKFTRGENHHLFIPGGTARADGYFRTTINGKREYVHRLVAAEILGRPLKSSEHVHHIDESPGHNVKENLHISTNSEHRKIHAAKDPRSEIGRFICKEH
jgi:hypothetical protein